MAKWREEAEFVHTLPTALLDEPKWRKEAVPIEIPAPREWTIADLLEEEKKIKDIVGISSDSGIPASDVELFYDQLAAKPSRAPVNIGPALTKPWWERFKTFFQGDESNLPIFPERMDRVEKLFYAGEAVLGMPLYVLFKYWFGRTLNTADPLVAGLKRVMPKDFFTDEARNMTLEEMVESAAAYNPTGFMKLIGEIAEFTGRMQTVAPIAQKMGLLGPKAKDIRFWNKAAQTAKIFAAGATAEQILKVVSEKIDPSETEYGYEGPRAVFRDFLLGAIFSVAHSGLKAGWNKLSPNEMKRAMKLLHLSETDAIPLQDHDLEVARITRIRHAANRVLRNYHPDKATGLEAEFKKVIKARDLLIKGKEIDIVFRGQKVTFEPKLLPGETLAMRRAGEKAAITPAAKAAIQKKPVSEVIAAHPELRGRTLGEILEESQKPVRAEIRPEAPPAEAKAAGEIQRIANAEIEAQAEADVAFEGMVAHEVISQRAPYEAIKTHTLKDAVDASGILVHPETGKQVPAGLIGKLDKTRIAINYEMINKRSIDEILSSEPSYQVPASIFNNKNEFTQFLFEHEKVHARIQAQGFEFSRDTEERLATKRALDIVKGKNWAKEALEKMEEKAAPVPPEKAEVKAAKKVETDALYKEYKKLEMELESEEAKLSSLRTGRDVRGKITEAKKEAWRMELGRKEREVSDLRTKFSNAEKAWRKAMMMAKEAPPAPVPPEKAEVKAVAPPAIELPSEKIPPAKPGQISKVLNKFLQEEAGSIKLPDVAKTIGEMGKKAEQFGEDIKANLIDELKFYPNVPAEFRNAVRKDFIGAAGKARENIYNNAANAIWKDLSKEDIQKSVEIIYAKDQLSRAKLGKGNPTISVEEAQQILNDLMADASDMAKAAAERFKKIHDAYTHDLIERGILEEGQLIEDHVRHYVKDYTPEWAPTSGIPIRLRRPFRGYVKKAVGTVREYRQDQEAILASLMEVEYHNLVEDFITEQVAKYDIKPNLSREQRIGLFGTNAAGNALPGKPGRIYDIEGKRYRGYTPDIPFSRAIYLTENGEAALGSYKNVSIIPEEIYNAFRNFSQRGSWGIAKLNQATRWWKTMAILSHYPSFNINNMVGDTWMAMVQHPDPTALLAEYDTAIRYLLGKGEGEFFRKLDVFVKEHDIKWTFVKSETAAIRNTGNPLGYILEKCRDFSDFRESINRVAYAASLLRAAEQGQGIKMIKAHDWIDTEGLNTEDALGKIAREVMTDYEAVSKPFRRFVSGGVAPFGTFYLKTSLRIAKWFLKHPIKGLSIFMSIPLAAAAYNNRRKDIRDLEEKLPDFVRNKTHFVLGQNPDGTIRVLSLQLPQDVLIGTKIFSIIPDYASRVIAGEMNSEEAALKMFKMWGVRELEGVKYLLSPWIRMYSGLASEDGRDPYDKAPIYRRDRRTLDFWEKHIDQMMYFIKCSVPFLGASIQTYEKGLPQDIALHKYIDTLAGKGAFGIYDIDPKGEVLIEREGKTYRLDWDTVARMKAIENKQMKYLGRVEKDFIASGLEPREYINTERHYKHLVPMFGYWAKFVPQLRDKYTEEEQGIFVANALRQQIENLLMDPGTLQKWYEVKRERARTDEEKTALAEQYKMIPQQRIIQAIKTTSKTGRTTELNRIFSEAELPWDLILELR